MTPYLSFGQIVIDALKLRCPFFFKMENFLYDTLCSNKAPPLLNNKTKTILKLSGLKINESYGIFFHFVPKRQYSGIFDIFHMDEDNGLNLCLTKKAVLDRVTIPNGCVFGFLYAMA